MNLLYRTDSFILAIFQAFSNFVQRHLGFDNFHLADACGVCSIGLVTVVITASKSWADRMIGFAIIGYVTYETINIIHDARNSVHKHGKFKNLLEMSPLMKLFRLAMLGTAVLPPIKEWLVSLSIPTTERYLGLIALHRILLISVFYFSACTPLPPEYNYAMDHRAPADGQ